MGTPLHLGDLPTPTRLKLAASALLTVLVTVLLAFAIGEVAGGDLSGLQHLLQALPLLLLLAAAWRYPRPAGLALIGVAMVLLPVWLLLVFTDRDPALRDIPIMRWAGTGALFFLPPLVAGWLLFRAGRRTP